MIHRFDPQNWSTELTHRIDPQNCSTELIHRIAPQNWYTELMHRIVIQNCYTDLIYIYIYIYKGLYSEKIRGSIFWEDKRIYTPLIHYLQRNQSIIQTIRKRGLYIKTSIWRVKTISNSLFHEKYKMITRSLRSFCL